MLSRQGVELLLLSRKHARKLFLKGLLELSLLLLESFLGLAAHGLLNNLLLLEQQLDLLLLMRFLCELQSLIEGGLQRLLQLRDSNFSVLDSLSLKSNLGLRQLGLSTGSLKLNDAGLLISGSLSELLLQGRQLLNVVLLQRRKLVGVLLLQRRDRGIRLSGLGAQSLLKGLLGLLLKGLLQGRKSTVLLSSELLAQLRKGVLHLLLGKSLERLLLVCKHIGQLAGRQLREGKLLLRQGVLELLRKVGLQRLHLALKGGLQLTLGVGLELLLLGGQSAGHLLAGLLFKALLKRGLLGLKGLGHFLGLDGEGLLELGLLLSQVLLHHSVELSKELLLLLAQRGSLLSRQVLVELGSPLLESPLKLGGVLLLEPLHLKGQLLLSLGLGLGSGVGNGLLQPLLKLGEVVCLLFLVRLHLLAEKLGGILGHLGLDLSDLLLALGAETLLEVPELLLLLGGKLLLLLEGSGPLGLQGLLQGRAGLLSVELLVLALVELLLNLHQVVLQRGALLLQEVVLLLDLCPLLPLPLGLLSEGLVLLLHGLALDTALLELGLLLGELGLALLHFGHGAVQLALGLGQRPLPLLLPHASALGLQLPLALLKVLLQGLEFLHPVVEPLAVLPIARGASLEVLEELLGLLQGLLPGAVRIGLRPELDLCDHLAHLVLELHGGLGQGVLLGEHVLQALPQQLDKGHRLVSLGLRVLPAGPDLAGEGGLALLHEGLLVEARHSGAQATGEAQ